MKTGLSIVLVCLSLLIWQRAQAQTCTATTPIQPALRFQYCAFEGLPAERCSESADEIALWLEARKTGGACEYTIEHCGCQGPFTDPRGTYAWCGYVPTNRCSGTAGTCASPLYSHALYRKAVCPAGYTETTVDNGRYLFPTGQCIDRSALAEDAAAIARLQRIERDAHGNITQLIDRRTNLPITKFGDYDEHGRPVWYEEEGLRVTLTWPADGGILPETMAGVRLHWADALAPGRHIDQFDVGTLRYKFTYWPNDSVSSLLTSRNGVNLTLQTWRENGTVLATTRYVPVVTGPPSPVTPPPTFTITAPPTFGAAAVPTPTPAPTPPQVGVHQITMIPGGSVFQLGALAIGASILAPLSGELASSVVGFLGRCFTQSAQNDDLLTCKSLADDRYRVQTETVCRRLKRGTAAAERCWAQAMELYSQDIAECDRLYGGKP